MVVDKEGPGMSEQDEQAMSIRLPVGTHRRLRRLYAETGRSMNSMVNEAVETWLPGAEAEQSGSGSGEPRE
jgi:predicted DNA-binding protein